MIKILLIIFTLIPINISASEVIEIPRNVDDLNLEVIKIIQNITHNGMKPNDVTQGFNYRLEDKWHSSFHLNIYLTKFNKSNNNSLMRIESPLKGTEKAIKQIMEAELLKQGKYPDKKTYGYKNYIVSEFLNLVHPAASVYYNSLSSPIYNDDDVRSKMGKYILYDIIIAGTAILYSQRQTPKRSLLEQFAFKPKPESNPLKGKNSGIIIGALAISRIVRIVGAAQDTGANNELVQFYYSKNIE